MNDQTHIRRRNRRPQPTPVRYQIDTVSSMEGLARIKPEWDALLEQDPKAGVFLSHDWLASGFEAAPDRWRVYVLRDGLGSPLCIFPVKQRLHWSQSRGQFQTELEAAGRLAWGEYTGFICDPAREEEGLEWMGRAFQSLPWKSMSLRYEPTKTRLETFAAALGDGFSSRFRSYMINKGTTDNLISPQIPLSGDFDSYLQERVSANTRQKIRRRRRKLLDSGTYQLTTSTEETVERDVSHLLTNWLANWGDKKGAANATALTERYARAMMTAQELGALHLVALWQGDRMVGALGHIVDWRQKSNHFLLAGRDPEAEDPAIGLLLHAHSIEWSIQNGLKTYDFGHGDEAYKFSFGPEKIPSYYMTIRREGAENVLDPSGLKPALMRLADFAKAGKTDQVEQAAQQLSNLLPN